MGKMRIGIVGLGSRGSDLSKVFTEGKVRDAVVVAVCDVEPSRLEWAKKNIAADVQIFDHIDAFYQYKDMDAVIIVTPHYFHPPFAIQGLQNGYHVLIEKPAGVFTKQVREMNEVALKSDKVLGIMLNQRTSPAFQKLRELVNAGELGEIVRTNWIVTNWFRSQHYYDAGGWRATWRGEGGGVLINQSPHQLDLLQWTCGMPKRVMAFCHFGKSHSIEVEDEVSAYLEYENGATGVFITSTSEANGTNRFEVIGEKGKVVIEEGSFKFWKQEDTSSHIIATSRKGNPKVEQIKVDIDLVKGEVGHVGILNNWLDHIRTGTPLLAPGIEGIHTVQLINAMLLSSWTSNWVELPVNEEQYYEELQKKIKASKYVKKENEFAVLDMSGTFNEM